MNHKAALDLLLGRMTESREGFTDVLFGVRKLLEAIALNQQPNPQSSLNPDNPTDPHARPMADPTLQPGRLGILEDLRRKADEAESTHDPAVIQNLLDALTAFLSEEANEAGEEADMAADAAAGNVIQGKVVPPQGQPQASRQVKPQMKSAPPGVTKGEGMAQGINEAEESGKVEAAATEVRRAAAEADGFMAYDEGSSELDEATEARRAAAEADGFAKYAPPVPAAAAAGAADPAAGPTMKCEACGALNKLPPPNMEATEAKEGAMEATESKEAKEATEATEAKTEAKRESAKEPEWKQRRLVEAERLDYARLKMKEQRESLRVKAGQAIEKAGAVGYVRVEDLIGEETAGVPARPFHESQWPTIIGFGLNSAPRPMIGAGPKEYGPTNERRAPVSAADAFRESMGMAPETPAAKQ